VRLYAIGPWRLGEKTSFEQDGTALGLVFTPHGAAPLQTHYSVEFLDLYPLNLVSLSDFWNQMKPTVLPVLLVLRLTEKLF
jgi:hypothetical protein